jgi:capsular exopolysaccharide synthesis family protein
MLEAYRLLRTSVLRSDGEDPVRSVAITSAEPNEGKTLSSVNLAVAVALDGKSVILVDADLRHAGIHRHFGLSNEVGFTNVVAGERPLEDALQDTSIPGLRLLASGPLHPSPPELLNSRASRACFHRLSQIADFVVVDTPPALLMADAHIVARMTDGVLLVVSAKESAKHRLDRTSYLLRQTGARLLGTVLNKADEGLGGYYGYHRYPYYRGAGLLVVPEETESDPSEEA